MTSDTPYSWRRGSSSTERPWALSDELETIENAPDADQDYASLPRDNGSRKRKRISKACEACRRRKIKCDGKEVCGGCSAASLECFYSGVENEKLIKDNLQVFDSRLHRLEGMFEQFLKKMDNYATSPGSTSSGLVKARQQVHRQPTPAPSLSVAQDGGLEEEFESIQANTVAEDNSGSDPVLQLTELPRGPMRLTPDRGSHRKHRKLNKWDSRRHGYADAYGELQPDASGNLRYIGLGSTRAMVDVCTPFREYLNRGISKEWSKYGQEGPNSTPLAFSGNSRPATDEVRLEALAGQVPPRNLLVALANWYYDRLYFMLPVVSQTDFEKSFAKTKLEAGVEDTGGFAAVVYGVLALAALSFPKDHEVFQERAAAAYKHADMGALFFDEAVARSAPNMTFRARNGLPRPNINSVNAITLQAAYLSTTGNQADAWMCIGQAARIAQDIGLHRSPALLGFNKTDQEKRKYSWWCIYSLDRMLSVALGRPVAIRDMDCDVELESEDLSDETHMGFLTILALRKILGQILDTVSAVGSVKDNRHVNKIPQIRARVTELSSALQTWVTDKVPESLKAAEEGNPKLERLLALSGYFSALMLLYRYLMSNPHRSSPLKGGEAAVQCARAATNCIGITSKLLDSMPVSPDLIFHFQNVFTASMVLLHCIRRSEDPVFKDEALKHAEVAIHCLRRLQPVWPEVETMTRCLEEYLELILESLEKGASFRKCLFHHDAHELTGLEWRHETSDEAMNFPVWPDMDLTNFFGLDMNVTNIPSQPDPGRTPQIWPGDGVPTPANNPQSMRSTAYSQRSADSPSGMFSLDSRLQAMDQTLWGYMYPQGTSDTASNCSASLASAHLSQR